MRLEPLPRRRHGLRLAPLVDVVFLLLIFFMLVARLEAPRTLAMTPPSGDGTLTGAVLLRIDRAARLDLNGTRIGLAQLPERLAPYLERQPRPPVVVQAAPDLPLQQLVDVLDRLAASGVAKPLLIEHGASRP